MAGPKKVQEVEGRTGYDQVVVLARITQHAVQSLHDLLAEQLDRLLIAHRQHSSELQGKDDRRVIRWCDVGSLLLLLLAWGHIVRLDSDDRNSLVLRYRVEKAVH